MALIIYQIGDYPIFNHMVGVGENPVGFEDSLQWRIESDNLSNVSGQYMAGRYSSPLLAPRKIKLVGGFENDENGTSDQKLNRLAGFGGRVNVPVIAFEYHEPTDDVSVPSINWLLTHMTIEGVDRATNYITREAVQLSARQITVAAQQQTAWRRLSPWFWEYRQSAPVNNPFDRANQQEGLDNRFYHPSKLASLSKRGFFRFWGDDLVRYAPSFWAKKYSDGITGGLGADFDYLPLRVQLFPPFQDWNAQPLSLYAFTSLLGQGELTITVDRMADVFTPETYSSSLDLAEVDSQLNSLGYSGLLEEDVLIAGRCSPFPSFILRDGEVLSGFIPRWEYRGTIPGELSAGPNQITFTCEGVAAQAAYLIDFGVY